MKIPPLSFVYLQRSYRMPGSYRKKYEIIGPATSGTLFSNLKGQPSPYKSLVIDNITYHFTPKVYSHGWWYIERVENLEFEDDIWKMIIKKND